MKIEASVLCFQSQRAESEQILDRAVLVFVDLLQGQKVDAFLLVSHEERFLDAMNPSVGDHDDGQEVAIETDEKFKLHDEEKQKKNR